MATDTIVNVPEIHLIGMMITYHHILYSGFPPCECLSNGRTIKYKPSYRDASEIKLKIKNVCQVFDSYIIYAAEKIVGEHHSDIELAELYINFATSKTKTTTSKGDFSLSISSLTKSTTYYFKCYSIVDGVTYEGEVMEFTTL